MATKKESVWLNLYFVKAVEVTPEVLQRVSEETGEQCENVLDVVKEIFNDGGDLALELVNGVDDVSVSGAFGVDGVYAKDPNGVTVSMVGDTKEEDCLITGVEAIRGMAGVEMLAENIAKVTGEKPWEVLQACTPLDER